MQRETCNLFPTKCGITFSYIKFHVNITHFNMWFLCLICIYYKCFCISVITEFTNTSIHISVQFILIQLKSFCVTSTCYVLPRKRSSDAFGLSLGVSRLLNGYKMQINKEILSLVKEILSLVTTVCQRCWTNLVQSKIKHTGFNTTVRDEERLQYHGMW